MTDEHPFKCARACPVTERERDSIWRRIDELKLMVTTLDKSQAVQQAELLRVSNRVETVHDHMLERLDAIHGHIETLVKKVNSDSDELRRREGAEATNRKWARGVILVLGLLFAGGMYVGFQPAIAAIAAPAMKDQTLLRVQTVERVLQ